MAAVDEKAREFPVGTLTLKEMSLENGPVWDDDTVVMSLALTFNVTEERDDRTLLATDGKRTETGTVVSADPQATSPSKTTPMTHLPSLISRPHIDDGNVSGTDTGVVVLPPASDGVFVLPPGRYCGVGGCSCCGDCGVGVGASGGG